MKANNKTEKPVNINKINTYVIHTGLRGRKPSSNVLSNSLRLVSAGEYFFTKASNQPNVHSYARSLNKAFTTKTAAEGLIKVTCTATW